MKFNKMKLGVLFSIFFSTNVLAVEESQKTVTSIGIEKEATAYFRVSEGWSINCSYDVMYLENNTDFGKAALSTILTAKSTGKKLSRVVYSQSESGTCQLYLVEIE